MTWILGLFILGGIIIIILVIFGIDDFKIQPGSESNLDFDRDLLPLHFDSELKNNKDLEEIQINSVKAFQDQNFVQALDLQDDIRKKTESPIPKINDARIVLQYNESLLQKDRITLEEFETNRSFAIDEMISAQTEINREPRRFFPEVSKYLKDFLERL